LEYPNIILYRFVSSQRQAYAEICEGMDAADLRSNELTYRRAKDKHDRSLELWKFYVNALYVALTRAVEQLFLIESDAEHPLLQLLNIHDTGEQLQVQTQASSREDWEREAHRLELGDGSLWGPFSHIYQQLLSHPDMASTTPENAGQGTR